MEEEKEFKGMISSETYRELSFREWDKEIIQTNFYYTNSQFIDTNLITIRVRCIHSQFFLQVKMKHNMSNGVRISREYEQELSSVPKLITEDTIRNLCNDVYTCGDVKLMGFLVTQRKIKQVIDVEIALDRNMYAGKTDYEIEFEYKNGIEDVNELISKMKLSNQLHIGKGKFERFKERLKVLSNGVD